MENMEIAQVVIIVWLPRSHDHDIYFEACKAVCVCVGGGYEGKRAESPHIKTERVSYPLHGTTMDERLFIPVPSMGCILLALIDTPALYRGRKYVKEEVVKPDSYCLYDRSL